MSFPSRLTPLQTVLVGAGLLLLLGSLTVCSTAPARSDTSGVVRYVLTELPGLGGHSIVKGVWTDPESGEVYAVGTAEATNAPVRAVLWHNQEIKVLDSLGGPSEAVALRVVNGKPLVAGSSRSPGGGNDEHAVIWDDGGLVELPEAGRVVSRANGIDALGTVVGETRTADTSIQGASWSAGQLTDLESDPYYRTSATAVEGLAIVGYRARASKGPSVASLWQSGQRTELGTLGGMQSFPYGVATVSGTLRVVGESNPPLTSATHAFFWQNGVISDLGTLGGGMSGATAINSAGQVVGWSWDETHRSQAALWEQGKSFDLNRLVLNGANVQLFRATAIDANGVIAAVGSEGLSSTAHAYLLRPVLLTDTPPLISEVAPSSGTQGQTLDVVIRGTGLTPTTHVDFGPGVTVNHVGLSASRPSQPGGATLSLTANLTLAGDARLGLHPVKVTNPDLQWDRLEGAFTVLQGPAALNTFSFDYNTSVKGGTKLRGMVTLSLPAPAPRGAKVTFSTSDRRFPAPKSIKIAPGWIALKHSLVYKTRKVRKSTTYTLTAAYGGVARAVPVTLLP